MGDKPETVVYWDPRHGARSFNARETEKLDFAALEAAAGIKLADSAQVRLVSAIDSYFSDGAYLAGAPSAEAVRRRMVELERHARALAEWLAVKDSADHAILHEAFAWRLTHPETIKPVLWHIVGLLRDARRRMRVKRGRPGDDPRRALLRTLHDIYRESGGLVGGIYWNDYSSKYAGPFLDLVHVLCCQARIPTAGIADLAREVAREAPRQS